MQTSPWSRLAAPAALALLILCAPAAQAQDFSQWAKVVSFRPESKVQEKLQARPADANGDRPHVLKIEHARGSLMLNSCALVINKLPAFDGKALGIATFGRFLRVHLPEIVSGTKNVITLGEGTEKANWESDSAEGEVIKWSDKQNNTDTWMMVADAGSDRFTLSMLSVTKDAQPHLMSGNVQITVSSASPLDGCLVQVRGAVRATSAATQNDEWMVAERFAASWIDALEQLRKWTKDHGGDCLPELAPPTMAMVPWGSVAKWFHQPQTPWVGIEGAWASTDREKRFRIEFHSEVSCDFIERNKSGKELRVTCAVTRADGDKGGFTIERPNDNEDVLSFYDFKQTVRTAIIERKPEPSKLVLKRNSAGKLIGQWYGLSISRDVGGNLQEIKQPSKGTPRLYDFAPVGD